MAICEYYTRDYPPRLYPEGESNLENKSISHNSKMGEFPMIREAIGNDVWEEMKELPVGIIAKLADSQFVWSGKTVHYLLCRQLRVNKKEIWCLIGDQPIRFGLHEFHEITGLNIDPMPTEKFEPTDEYKEFLKELGVSGGEGPNLNELRPGLLLCRKWPTEKRKWLGLLLLQAIGLYGLHPNSRIPLESANRVCDDEAMKTYPWGRSAFEALVNSVRMLQPKGASYTLSGMVQVLQVWAYRSVQRFRELFGRDLETDDILLLRWGGNRTRSSMESIIAGEIEAHGEVRVRKMVMKEDLQELFHTWTDEDQDPALDNLIRDIHANTFVKGFWDVNRNQKKKVVKAKAATVSEHPAKKQKVNHAKNNVEESSSDEVVVTKKKNKKTEDLLIKGVSGDEDDLVKEVSVRALMRMFEDLAGRFEKVETSIRGIATNLENLENLENAIADRVEVRVDAKFEPRITHVENRVDYIENEWRQFKESMKFTGVCDNVNNGGDDMHSHFRNADDNEEQQQTPKVPLKQPPTSFTSPMVRHV